MTITVTGKGPPWFYISTPFYKSLKSLNTSGLAFHFHCKSYLDCSNITVKLVAGYKSDFDYNLLILDSLLTSDFFSFLEFQIFWWTFFSFTTFLYPSFYQVKTFIGLCFFGIFPLEFSLEFSLDFSLPGTLLEATRHCGCSSWCILFDFLVVFPSVLSSKLI